MTYGLPYKGSKNKIAEKIIDLLPPGKRLVDLFGGGGAITHCAALRTSGKWETVLYRELNPMVADTFKKAINGYYKKENGFKPYLVTRDQFKATKNTDGYAAMCFSFGGDTQTYCFGAGFVEDAKCAAFKMLTSESFEDRFKAYTEYVKAIESLCKDGVCKKHDVDKLFGIQPLYSYKRFLALSCCADKISVECGSYEDVELKEGDVAYCDPPYENTKGYGQKFDSASFYDWCVKQTAPVFVSSYEINHDGLTCVAEFDKIQLICAMDNSKIVKERVYANAKALELMNACNTP